MSRMNNTSRSLQIISQQNGWDPTVIQASQQADWKDGPPVDFKSFYHVRETPYEQFSSTSSQLPDDPQAHCNYTEAETRPSFSTPVQRELENHATTNADPFPEMPGSRPQGSRR